ncbi:MAG: hypothetical protein ACFNUK_09650, partial [Schaalia sp.]
VTTPPSPSARNADLGEKLAGGAPGEGGWCSGQDSNLRFSAPGFVLLTLDEDQDSLSSTTFR